MKLILFVLMVGVFAVLAARPQIRSGIRWGRTAKRHPVSIVGYYGILVGFLMVFISPFAADRFGSADWILLAFAGFVVFMGAGLYDRLRRSRERSKPTKPLTSTNPAQGDR